MKTAIGRQFQNLSHNRMAAAMAIGVIAVDMAALKLVSDSVRASLALVAFAVLVGWSNGDLEALGLRARPVQGWRPWIVTGLKIGIAVALILAISLGIWYLLGNEIPVYSVHPKQIGHAFLHMCFVAPVLEEAIYRVLLCVTFVGLIGEWKTIAVSGVLFGVLHVIYGNASPENLVGGFFLAWAYLKSETVLMPVLLHAIGNAFAFASQVAAWYYLNGFG